MVVEEVVVVRTRLLLQVDLVEVEMVRELILMQQQDHPTLVEVEVEEEVGILVDQIVQLVEAVPVSSSSLIPPHNK